MVDSELLWDSLEEIFSSFPRVFSWNFVLEKLIYIFMIFMHENAYSVETKPLLDHWHVVSTKQFNALYYDVLS